MTTIVEPRPVSARILGVLSCGLIAFGCVISLPVGGVAEGDGEGSESGSPTQGHEGSGVVDGTTSSATTSGSEGDGSESGASVPATPTPPSLSFSSIKQFDFSWSPAAGADHYRLLERVTPGEPWGPLGADIVGEAASLTMPLHLRAHASYVLQACNAEGCSDSAAVDVGPALTGAVGYLKAPTTNMNIGDTLAISADGETIAVRDSSIDGDSGAVYVFARTGTATWSEQAYLTTPDPYDDFDYFGSRSIAISANGDTLAVGAPWDDSGATGIDGDQSDDSVTDTGATYVFVRDDQGQWSQQAYVKASNAGYTDLFGVSVDLSGDGNTLAVGAPGERSAATGVGGDQGDDSANTSGAVYVFVRDAKQQWSQQAYVKASNTDAGDYLGDQVALSDDGNTLAASAPWERSGATGVDGDQSDDSVVGAGAVYVFVRDARQQWSQQAYVKASNTDRDLFGFRLALSGDGGTLVSVAPGEDSAATGIDGDQSDESAEAVGAAYVFVRDAAQQWSQQAYVKASNTKPGNSFGGDLALATNGSTLAISTYNESSSATGIDGDQADELAPEAGAVYVFVRDPLGQWSQRAYVKAPNTDPFDGFGWDVGLSGDGLTLVVGAPREDGAATGTGGDPTSNRGFDTGAVYFY